ncbi:MAG: methyltransferase domain-containing protein [Chloroflexota bacterium]
MIDIQTFYDEHPINEAEILSKLQEAGKSLDTLTPADLYPYDQDHYGGLAANDALATALQLSDKDHVIDLCSGMGGPARYLAAHYGCRVHGVDLNQSRVNGATRLTGRVGLAEQVTFSQGDVTKLEMPGRFDAVISQEAFLHIPNKEKLLAVCFAMLRHGGRLGFTDWTAASTLTTMHRQRFATTFAAERILSIDEYHALLADTGFVDIQTDDLSAQWREILHGRLEMFRSLESETVRRFGQVRHDTYITNYEFFVERIDAGDLGGVRVIVKRP